MMLSLWVFCVMNSHTIVPFKQWCCIYIQYRWFFISVQKGLIANMLLLFVAFLLIEVVGMLF